MDNGRGTDRGEENRKKNEEKCGRKIEKGRELKSKLRRYGKNGEGKVVETRTRGTEEIEKKVVKL